MSIKESIRKVLMEEFPQEDYSNKIIKNVAIVDSIIRALYPNFNNEGTYLKKITPLAWNTELDTFLDNETNEKYCSYNPKRRELYINREVYMTLENYLNEDVATYIIDWFNNEFGADAESVTF